MKMPHRTLIRMPTPKQEQPNHEEDRYSKPYIFLRQQNSATAHASRLSSFFLLGHTLSQTHASFVPLEHYRTVALDHVWTVKRAED